MARPEELLTARCADFLRLAAPPDLFFLHIPNEGQRHVVGHTILKAMGFVVGAPDLLLIFRGQVFVVEVKVHPKKPTADQLEVMRRVIEAGGRAAWIDNLNDFIRQVKAWGIVAA